MFQYDLTLRKLNKNDIKKLFLLKTEAFDNHHRVAIINDTDQEEWFNSLNKDVYHPKNLILIGMQKKLDIGVVFLTNINYINKTSDIGIDIYKKYRGKGYGTKLMSSGIQFCKKILNLRKLNCEVLQHNVASMRMCEKNGFVQEGIRKEQIHKRGLYIDSIMYGLII
jgi:RimJ/RimL family protein N-acetyltransferase